MKKLLLLLLIVLLGVVIIAPKLISGQVKQNLTDVVALIDKNPMYSAKVVNYSSEWFSTQAQIALTLKLNKLPQNPGDNARLTPVSMNLNFTAQHGPIVLSPQPSLGWIMWHVDVSGESLGPGFAFSRNTPFYQVSSATDLLGWSSFTDSLQAFRFDDEQGISSANFSGWQGSGSYSQLQFSYQGKAQSLGMNSPQLNLEMTNWSIDLDAQTSLAKILDGQLYNSFSQVQIEQITMTDPVNQQQGTLDELKITSTSTLSEDKSQADIEFALNLGALQSSMLAGKDWQFNVQLKHLTADFIKAYQRLIADLQNLQPDQEQQHIEAFLQQHLLGQLQANPELNISSLQGTLTQGDFSAKIFNKITGVELLPTPLLDRNFWLSHLKTNATFKADKPVSIFIAKSIIKSRLNEGQNSGQLTSQQVDDYAQQQAVAIVKGLAGNVLTETPTGYAIEFSLADGQTKLNGKPIALPTY